MKHAILFLLSVLLFTCTSFLAAQTPWHYENDIREYVYKAIDNPPIPGCTLFVGSSSFRLWNDLEKTFAEYDAINRGFGGSQFPDNIRAMKRIHFPAQPSRIVIFCGTNDIASGADTDTVFNNFKYYIARFWNENPAVDIFFVSTTHAPSREKFWKTGDEFFNRVKALSEKVPGLHCIDIRPAMFGEDGKVRKDLFVNDMLHLNAQGYAIWEKVFKAELGKESINDLAYLYKSRKEAGLFDDPRFTEQDVRGVRINDYSKPMKKLNIVFFGDEITKGAHLESDSIMPGEASPPSQCAKFLSQNGFTKYRIANLAVDGCTTKRLRSKEVIHALTEQITDLKSDEPDSELIFSIMLGANDEASPEEYRHNLQAIIDTLLAEYPKCKVMLHLPISYNPSALFDTPALKTEQCLLRAYYTEIATLVNYYSQTMSDGITVDKVCLGDDKAFRYFQTPAARDLSPEKQAEILGRFWGGAILEAVH